MRAKNSNVFGRHREATTDAAIGRFDSGQGFRYFCRDCGSPIWFESKDYPGVIGIPLGVIDAGDIPSPEMHLWVKSKPAWCSINDDKPKFGGGPDGAPTDAFYEGESVKASSSDKAGGE